MADKQDSKTLFAQATRDLGFTIHDVLRYGFTGILALLVFASSLESEADRKAMKSVLETTGMAGVALLTLSLGAVIYVISRQTMMPLGVAFSYYLAHRCNSLFSTQTKTRQRLLADEFQLGMFDTELAFAVLRSHLKKADGEQEEGQPLWSRDLQEQFFRQHSENHLLYATSLVFVLASVWHVVAWVVGGPSLMRPLFFVGVFAGCWACACFSDFQLFKREAALLKTVGIDQLRPILIKAGLITNGESPATVTDQAGNKPANS